MHIQYALVADGIIPGHGGKKNIIGTFNAIFCPGFPAKFATRMYLLVRVHAHDSEAGQHSMVVDLVDETGARLAKNSAKVDFALDRKTTIQGTPLSAEVVLEINGLFFPEAGNYDLTIRVDDTYLDSVPLYARLVKDA